MVIQDSNLLHPSAVASRYANTRLLMMAICLLPFLAGIIGLHLLPSESSPWPRLTCLWLSFCYTATWTLSMAVSTANTAGHTKKITTNAFLLMGYCLGNFVGPFFFVNEQAPRYGLGVGMMFFCVAVQMLCIAGMAFLFWKRNKARSGYGDRHDGDEFQDLTDLENLGFRVGGTFYSFEDTA